MVAPGRHGVRCVEPRDGFDLPQRRSTSGSPKSSAAQPSVGHAMTVQAVASRAVRSAAISRAAAAPLGGASGVDVAEQARIGVAEDEDERGALEAEQRDVDAVGRPVEQLLRRVDRVEAAEVLVAVAASDVARSRAPARLRDGPHERRVLGLAADDELLSRLEVRAHATANSA